MLTLYVQYVCKNTMHAHMSILINAAAQQLLVFVRICIPAIDQVLNVNTLVAAVPPVARWHYTLCTNLH